MTARWTRSDTGLLLLAIFWLALTIGLRPLALPDEGRYVSVAWEMLVSRQWLYPTLNGLPFFHKPPLFYWITAASLQLFGAHDWATRIASLFGAGLAAATMFGFALRQAGRRVARWTLLVLVTMPLLFASAQFATLDMLVAGCISATIVLAAEAAINAAGDRPYRGRLAAAYVCAALGVLSKGLIGAVLPGLAIVVWLAWSRRPALLLKLLWIPGLLLFAAVALPWFVAMQERFPGFSHYFFVYHQFQRYTEAGYNNPQPPWFYVLVILVGAVPWTWWLVTGWRGRVREARPTLSPLTLMWIWVVSITAFFSIPASKMIGYILPVLPPVAFIVAEALSRRWSGIAGEPRPLRWIAAGAAALCVAAVFIDKHVDTKSDLPLSKAIAAQRQPGEPVIFLKDEFFDAVFYLKLAEPPPIFDDWNRTGPRDRDDWRKALLDAAQFDPAAGRRVLLEIGQFNARLCSQPTSWVIARMGAAAAQPALAGKPWVARRADRAVWKVSAADLVARGLCTGAPAAGGATASPRSLQAG